MEKHSKKTEELKQKTFFKGRSIGNLKLDKSKLKTGKTSVQKLQSLPRHQRLNPNLDPPELTEDIMGRGLSSLLNEGFIPKGVDVTPAFERGCPTLNAKRIDIRDSKEKVRIFTRKTDDKHLNLD